MLQIASLNTGSNGNCFYIGNETEAVLIDAGISCRETEKRMQRLSLDMGKVKAIFVSHEHGDHITGVPGLSKKYQLPVYITKNTFAESNIPVADNLLFDFRRIKQLKIGSLLVVPFKKHHDAADPHSFMISCNGVNVGVITDIGHSCPEVVRCFKQCHAVFLESNYCDDMLDKGNYPFHLKKRISSDHGHLSNAQALDLFLSYRSPQLTHLILSHLSKNNNSPKVVERLFSPHAGTTQITVASRYQETAVFTIAGSDQPMPVVYYKKKQTDEFQLSLFGE
jgi:phosphoribosyl 1,2-cyclic phosphodiesterase